MRKSKALTFFLSFVPGVGHLYLGLMNRGLQFLIIFFGTTLFSNLFFSNIFNFILPIIWFYCLFDALQQYNKLVDNPEYGDTPIVSWNTLSNNSSIFGWILIAMGILVFADKMLFTLFDYKYYGIIKTIVVAILFIFIGIYLISGKRFTTNKKIKEEK